MQSLYALRALFNILALLTAWVAFKSHTWLVIEEPNSNGTTQTLVLTPTRYCLKSNGTSKCSQYSNLMVDLVTRHKGITAIKNVGKMEPQQIIPATTHDRLEQAVASWCKVRTDISWILQGAETMICLVILESCMYTIVMWVVALASCTLSSVIALWFWRKRRWSCVFMMVNYISYAPVCLSFMVWLEWWWYTVSFVDTSVLESLHLSAHTGLALRLVVISMVFSLTALRISIVLSSPQPNLARLFTLPLHQSTSNNAQEAMETLDPLKCTPNYRV